MAFAPEGIVEDLRKLRAGCPRSGRAVMDCHVTVRRGFEPPYEPAAVTAAISGAVQGCPAFSVRTLAEPEIWGSDGERAVVFPLEPCRPLERLHERVAAALGPLTSANPTPFRPHVTIVERVSNEAAEQTLRAIAGWRVNYAWVVRDIDLVGLEGNALWRSQGHFTFGRP